MKWLVEWQRAPQTTFKTRIRPHVRAHQEMTLFTMTLRSPTPCFPRHSFHLSDSTLPTSTESIPDISEPANCFLKSQFQQQIPPSIRISVVTSMELFDLSIDPGTTALKMAAWRHPNRTYELPEPDDILSITFEDGEDHTSSTFAVHNNVLMFGKQVTHEFMAGNLNSEEVFSNWKLGLAAMYEACELFPDHVLELKNRISRQIRKITLNGASLSANSLFQEVFQLQIMYGTSFIADWYNIPLDKVIIKVVHLCLPQDWPGEMTSPFFEAVKNLGGFEVRMQREADCVAAFLMQDKDIKLQVGQNIAVMDAGGGTIDLKIFTVCGRTQDGLNVLRYTGKGDTIDEGSQNINAKIIDGFLASHRLVGGSESVRKLIRTTESELDALRLVANHQIEEAKCRFGTECESVTPSLPSPHGSSLVFSSEITKHEFTFAIEGLAQLAAEYLHQLCATAVTLQRPREHSPARVFIVGGLSRNAVFVNGVRNSFMGEIRESFRGSEDWKRSPLASTEFEALGSTVPANCCAVGARFVDPLLFEEDTLNSSELRDAIDELEFGDDDSAMHLEWYKEMPYISSS